MKIRLLVVLPFFGSAMYVLRPAMVSTRPVGVPSCMAPLRQHELIPTFSDMVISMLGMGFVYYRAQDRRRKGRLHKHKVNKYMVRLSYNAKVCGRFTLQKVQQ